MGVVGSCRVRKDGVRGHELSRASGCGGPCQGFGVDKGGRVEIVGSCGESRDGVSAMSELGLLGAEAQAKALAFNDGGPMGT